MRYGTLVSSAALTASLLIGETGHGEAEPTTRHQMTLEIGAFAVAPSSEYDTNMMASFSQEDSSADIGDPAVVEADPTQELPGIVFPDMPESIAKDLQENTARIISSGCSGRLIRDQLGLPIGALTAEHCGLKYNYASSDGMNYEPMLDLRIATGDTTDTLVTVGVVSETQTWDPADTTHDSAILAINGNSLEEVASAYQETMATVEDVGRLPLNTPVYLSGWPVHQQGAVSPELMNRQSFPLSYLGIASSSVRGGEYFNNVVFTAGKFSPDEAICSYGNSGGEGIYQDPTTGEIRTLGPLALFVDLKGHTQKFDAETIATMRSYYEALLGVSLEGVDVLCGFDLPDTKDDRPKLAAIAIQNIATIPNYQLDRTAEGHAIIARNTMNNPHIQKQVLQGFVRVNLPNGLRRWIENPVVFLDSQNYTVTALIADPKDPNGMQALELGYLEQIKVYRKNTPRKDSSDILSFTDFELSERGFSLPTIDGRPFLVGKTPVRKAPVSSSNTYKIYTNFNGGITTKPDVEIL